LVGGELFGGLSVVYEAEGGAALLRFDEIVSGAKLVRLCSSFGRQSANKSIVKTSRYSCTAEEDDPGQIRRRAPSAPASRTYVCWTRECNAYAVHPRPTSERYAEDLFSTLGIVAHEVGRAAGNCSYRARAISDALRRLFETPAHHSSVDRANWSAASLDD
jgi:hypothetical protein